LPFRADLNVTAATQARIQATRREWNRTSSRAVECEGRAGWMISKSGAMLALDKNIVGGRHDER
jgi:hypothetical protein